MKTIKKERRQTIVIGPKNYKKGSQIFVKSFRYSSSSECLPTTENHQIVPESPPTPTLFELLPAAAVNDVNLNDNHKSKVTLSWESSLVEIDQALELPLIPPRKPSHFYRGPSTRIDTNQHLQQQQQQQSQYYTHKRFDANKKDFSTQIMHSLVLSPPYSPSITSASCNDTEFLLSETTTTVSSENIEDFTTRMPSTVTCVSDNSIDGLQRLKRKQQLDTALDSIVSARSLLNNLLTVLP